MTESFLDRADRLDSLPVEEIETQDLMALIEDYLPSYEQPNSYFSGHNRFAALVREYLKRVR